MKKSILLLLVSLVMLGVIGFSEEYDVRKLNWGMSYKTVKEIEGLDNNFYKTEDPKVHCESLARLFSIQPLFGPNYENKAFNLFFDEPNSLESQREIYEACSNNSQDFILIVRKTYVTGVTQ